MNTHVFVRNLHGDAYLPEVNASSFDRDGAATVYRRQYGEELFLPNSLYVIVGSDSGRLMRHIAESGRPHRSRYLFVELDELIETIRQHPDTPAENDWMQLVSLDEWQSRAEKLDLLDALYIDRVRLLKSLGALDQYHLGYAQLGYALDEAMVSVRFATIVSLNVHRFIENQILNLADNLIPASVLANRFYGRTAIILAAGPSLDASLPWIRRYRQHFVLLAVSRVMTRLNTVGIDPDFIFTVDPNEISMNVSLGCFNTNTRAALIHSNHANSLIVAQFPGKRYYLADLLPWNSRLNRPNFRGAGPTVTNTALMTSYDMGFRRVLLVGVDLCFSPEGYCHAEGNAERKAGPRLDRISNFVLTNQGEQATTSADYAHALEQLRTQAQFLHQRGMQLLTPSPNAAAIEHVEFVPWESLPVATWLMAQEADSGLPSPDTMTIKRHLNSGRRELEKAQRALAAIGRLAERALGLNEALFSVHDYRQARHIKTRLDKIQYRIEHRYHRFLRLTQLSSLLGFLQINATLRDEEDLDPDDLKQLGANYYNKLVSGTRYLHGMLQQSLNILALRLREADRATPAEERIASWRLQGLSGRGEVWLRQFPDQAAQLSPEARAALSSLAADFSAELSRRQAGIEKSAEVCADPAHTVAHARYFYAHRQTSSLQQLLQSLNHHPDAERCRPYQALLKAYLQDIEGQTSSALETLMTVLPSLDMQPSRLLTDLLLAVTHMAGQLEQWELLTTTLECLAQCESRFMPHYADALWLQGAQQQALEAYAGYLERVPHDENMQWHLAERYQDAGIPDAARMLLAHIAATGHHRKEQARLRLLSLSD